MKEPLPLYNAEEVLQKARGQVLIATHTAALQRPAWSEQRLVS